MIPAVVVLLAAIGFIVAAKPRSLRLAEEAVGIGRPHRVLPAVAPAVVSGDYTVRERDAAGDPVTYDPCRPIHYAINPAGAPGDYLSFIQPAVAAVQAASGLEFIYDGPTTETFASHQGMRTSAPVVIAFPTVLAGSTSITGETVGLGGSTWSSLNGAIQPHYLTGAVALLESWFLQESARNATDAEQSVVMHELGHVVGLGHVNDPTQIMFANGHQGPAVYGSGDLAGLARLGAGQCEW